MRVLITLVAVLFVTCDRAQSKQDDSICDLCKDVVGYVEESLKSNQTDAEIKAELDKVCSEIPLIGSLCKEFVDQNLERIIMLVTNMSASQVCSELGLCKNASLHHLQSVKDSPLCEICQIVVQEVSTLLGENTTDAEIKSKLETLCSSIPLVGSLCKQIVDEYLDQIIEAIQKDLTPTEVCQQDLKLCNSSRLMFKAESPKSNVTCAACEFALKEVESLLTDNATKQEIVQAVEKVCTILPGTLKDECNQLIELYAPQIINLLSKIAPDQVCTEIGLCSEDVHLKANVAFAR